MTDKSCRPKQSDPLPTKMANQAAILQAESLMLEKTCVFKENL